MKLIHSDYYLKHLSIVLLLTILGLSNYAYSQQITNIKASYNLDTLHITYDLIGETNLDSLHVLAGSFNSNKKYQFTFYGDADKEITPGKNKIIYGIIPRDSFPAQGEALKIQLVGWAKNKSTHTSVFRFNFKLKMPEINLNKRPKNPRFSFVFGTGPDLALDFKTEPFVAVFAKFNYQPSPVFRIGLGAHVLTFKEPTSEEYPGIETLYINAEYDLAKYNIPIYSTMKYGYLVSKLDPALALGVGYNTWIYGPFGFNAEFLLHQITGSEEFTAVSLTAGLSLSFSQRNSFKREKYYRFRNAMMQIESGFNFYKKWRPAISGDLVFNTSPYYVHGIGLAFETNTFSLFYFHPEEIVDEETNQTITIFHKIQYELNLYTFPVYFTGRLYLTNKKFKPFIAWKYGVSLYAKTDKGQIHNGFYANSGLGFTIPISKYLAVSVQSGIKLYNYWFEYKNRDHHFFLIPFIQTGILF